MDQNPVIDDLRIRDRPTLVVRPEPDPLPDTIALLSGSFDPITVAHAAMADAAAKRADLVVLTYSVRTLPKDPDAPPPLLSEAERISALERFCENRPRCAVGLCSHGLLAEQVDAASERFPGSQLIVVIGSDKLLQLLDPSWYDDRDAVLGRMFERAEVLYAMREGDEAVAAAALADAPWSVQRLEISKEVASVSSRRVREFLREGDDVSGLVPEEIRPLLER